MFKNTIKIYLKNGRVLTAWKEGEKTINEWRFFKYVGFGKVVSINLVPSEVVGYQNNYKWVYES